MKNAANHPSNNLAKDVKTREEKKRKGRLSGEKRGRARGRKTCGGEDVRQTIMRQRLGGREKEFPLKKAEYGVRKRGAVATTTAASLFVGSMEKGEEDRSLLFCRERNSEKKRPLANGRNNVTNVKDEGKDRGSGRALFSRRKKKRRKGGATSLS